MDRFDMLALALALAIGSEKDTKKKEAKTKETTTEDTIDMLDRDITFGIRDTICEEHECGQTGCPLYVDGRCIGNHSPKGIKVKIPTWAIDAEAEYKKGLSE